MSKITSWHNIDMFFLRLYFFKSANLRNVECIFKYNIKISDLVDPSSLSWILLLNKIIYNIMKLFTRNKILEDKIKDAIFLYLKLFPISTKDWEYLDIFYRYKKSPSASLSTQFPRWEGDFLIQTFFLRNQKIIKNLFSCSKFSFLSLVMIVHIIFYIFPRSSFKFISTHHSIDIFFSWHFSSSKKCVKLVTNDSNLICCPTLSSWNCDKIYISF